MNKSVVKRDLHRIWRKLVIKPTLWVFFILALTFILNPLPKVNKLEKRDLLSLSQKIGINFYPIPLHAQIKINSENFPSDLSSQSIFIKEINFGEIIYQKNEHEQKSPASLTKILTALISIENCDLSKTGNITNVYSNGSLMGLQNGERVTYENLLYGMLVNSGNDAAEFLTRDCFGGNEQAVEKINQKIEFLNLKNTHFSDVMGISEQNHYSSAFDLTTLAEILLKNETLKKIVNTKEITLVSEDKNRWYSLKNTNDLLFENANVFGVKTGYTEEAGECLILGYQKENQKFIITLLESEDRFEDGRKIISWLESI